MHHGSHLDKRWRQGLDQQNTGENMIVIVNDREHVGGCHSGSKGKFVIGQTNEPHWGVRHRDVESVVSSGEETTREMANDGAEMRSRDQESVGGGDEEMTHGSKETANDDQTESVVEES